MSQDIAPSVPVGAQLQLVMAIVILVLLERSVGILSPTYVTALFSCISTPATYALAYYMRRRRFVAPAAGWPKTTQIIREIAALISSYAMGYIVFVASTTSPDPVTYTVAYIVVQAMRVFATRMVAMIEEKGGRPESPFMVALVSLATAAFGLALSYVFLPFIRV